MFAFLWGRQIKKAHLGEANNFYFHEEMNRWVERGRESEVRAEMAVSEPPKVAEPVSQEIKKTGLASKYVDTGFGKPGAIPLEHKTPLVPVPFGIKADLPQMNFFVPQLPSAPVESVPLDNDADHPNPDGQDKTPHAELWPTEDDGSNLKIGTDLLTDVFDPDIDIDHVSSNLAKEIDPLDEILGLEEGASSTQADSSKLTQKKSSLEYEAFNSGGSSSSPVPDVPVPLGNLVSVQAPEICDNKMDADSDAQNIMDALQQITLADATEIKEYPGILHDMSLPNRSQLEEAPLNDPLSSQGNTSSLVPNLIVPLEGMVIQGEGGGDKSISLDENAVCQHPQGTDNNDDAALNNFSALDPSGVDFNWTAEETATFYIWMEENFGPQYKEWTGEEWNNFWYWYNYPVQEDYGNESQSHTDSAWAETSCVSIASEKVPSGLDLTPNPAIEHQASSASGENENAGKLEATGGSLERISDVTSTIVLDRHHDADQASPQEANVALGVEVSNMEDDGQLTVGLPVTGATESPVPATASLNNMSEADASFFSGNLELSLQSDPAHLYEFFAHVSVILSDLTPESADLAKHRAECQYHLRMLLKSIEETVGCGSLNSMEYSTEARVTSQDAACLDEQWVSKMRSAEQEITALQIQLESRSLELTEAKEAMEHMAAEYKQAQDDGAINLRAELEECNQHRLMTLYEEFDAQKAEMYQLQASHGPPSLGGNSGQGDPQKLIQTLEEMKLLHSQEIADLQRQLNMKVSERSKQAQKELEVMEAPDLLTTLGLAEIQIRTLSNKLCDLHMDPDVLLSDALGEFIDSNMGL